MIKVSDVQVMLYVNEGSRNGQTGLCGSSGASYGIGCQSYSFLLGCDTKHWLKES